MQLAGTQCGICQQKVLFDGDGTWCSACKTIFHRECISSASEICPACRRRREAPERLFTYSHLCPECMRPNDPPQPRCAACQAATRWDNRQDYERFVGYVKNSSRILFIRGCLELVGAIVCLLVLLAALVSLIVGSRFLFGIVLVFMLLTTDGVVSIMKSRRLARFR